MVRGNGRRHRTVPRKRRRRRGRQRGGSVVLPSLMATASKLMGQQTVGGVAKKALKTLSKEILKRGALAAATTARRKANKIAGAIKRRATRLKRRLPGL